MQVIQFSRRSQIATLPEIFCSAPSLQADALEVFNGRSNNKDCTLKWFPNNNCAKKLMSGTITSKLKRILWQQIADNSYSPRAPALAFLVSHKTNERLELVKCNEPVFQCVVAHLIGDS